MALTRADLSNELIIRLGLNTREAKQLVELFFEESCKVLEKSDEVRFSGFGNFFLRNKKERPGRNPKTGEKVIVSARRVVLFHAGQKLREFIENKMDK